MHVMGFGLNQFGLVFVATTTSGYGYDADRYQDNRAKNDAVVSQIRVHLTPHRHLHFWLQAPAKLDA